jgi:hypothetical protein
MDDDIDRQFEPGLAAGFEELSNRPDGELFLTWQSSIP